MTAQGARCELLSDTEIVYIRAVLTHTEYDWGRWKE